MIHQFPELPYEYDALEPTIDEATMRIHHGKHHQAYFDRFTAAIEGTELESTQIEDILANISTRSPAIRNNGGGYFNHILYWNVMSPTGGNSPEGELSDAINSAFGSFEKLKEEFTNAALTQFGSGWAWLIVNAEGKLEVTSTANQDNPLMDTAPVKGTPILGCDVWEHAYYLNYQNKRPDYVEAWWTVVNWNYVSQQYKKALQG